MSKTRSGLPKRVAAGLLAGALGVFGLAYAPAAGADLVDAVEDACGRLAGQTRYGTAGAIADAYDQETGGTDTAIIANGRNFPDALAASGLARALDAPILLVEPPAGADEVPLETASALDDLGITEVVIVGGTAAVSTEVENALEEQVGSARRVAGDIREDTAAEIASEIGTAGSHDGLVTAIIATGDNYPDALAGGPVAYHGDGTNPFPILLTRGADVPASTEAALEELGVEQVIVLGGTAAVPPAAVAELATITGNDPIVLAGALREDTAAAVADFAVDELGFDLTTALLADGRRHFPSPDALSGGPLGGITESPILLVTPEEVPAPTEAWLEERDLEQLIGLGGTAAISAETLEAACDAAGIDPGTTPGAQGTATTRPELVSARIVETRTAAASTATRPAGTYVLYCFDEPITGAGITAGSFHLYDSAGTRYSGSTSETGGGQSFTSGVSTADNKCAEVIFGGPVSGGGALDTAAEAASLTLATNEEGAASGQGGDPSTEGDAPLTPASSAPAAAGVTAAPDLVSVGNFRAGSTADLTAVDFVFDQAAFVQNISGFRLVGTDGTTYLCQGSADAAAPSGLAAAGGSGTTTLTVSCQEPAGFPGNFAAANFARGVVLTGTVATTAGGANLNPLEAANVTGGANGSTDDPDLTGIIFAPDALVGADVVAFVYDEAVTTGVVPGSHYIYTTAGTENNAAACSRSGENNTIVTCAFADNTLSGANYVGGNVRAGGVTAADDGAAVAPDEEGTSPSAGPVTTTGRTDGPDLLSVTINRGTSPFGNATATATFTFDEDIADTASAALVTDNAAGGNSATGENIILSLLHLYTSDGIRLDCTSLSGGISTAQDSATLANRGEDADHQVTCTNFAVGGTTAGANVTAPAATVAQIGNAVVGTVEYGAVDDEAAGGDTNPEGHVVTTGGGGTPAS